MSAFFERFSRQKEYRRASIVLGAGAALPFISLTMGLAWGWSLLAFAVGMAFYIALAVLTYRRLHDAWLSGWWLLPMIMQFHLGPRWDLGNSITFYPSGFIALVPIMLGWFAASRGPETLPP